ncbi:MAG: OmpA family protein [Saprospiraceae bacterium]|nr:OmpA family protein [Saprospiraceae bacterium]
MQTLKITLFFFFLSLMSSYAQISPEEIKVIVNNENKINSPELEYSPTFYEDGIVFVSTKIVNDNYKIKDKRINKNIMSIYKSKRDANGILSDPISFSEDLLSIAHEGPVSFDRTNETIFFTRNNIKNGKKVKASDGIVKLKIYSASKKGNEWENIKELPFNDDESSACHPSLSVDGDEMYFASDRPGGFGGMDLYVVVKNGNDWSEPKNLGPEINTKDNEVFPYIHPDKTLYFSTNGRGGLGGLDIYYTRLMNGKFDEPQSLGKPFNSAQDDFGFIIDLDNKNGYFSSNRLTGKGEDDIYSFNVIGDWDASPKKDAKKDQDIDMEFVDEDGNPLDGAAVSFINLDDVLVGEQVDSTGRKKNVKLVSEVGENGETIVKMVVEDQPDPIILDKDGKLKGKLPPGNYVFFVNKEGYETQQFSVTPETMDKVQVKLKKAKGCVDLVGEITSISNGQKISGALVKITDEKGEVKEVYSDAKGNISHCLKCGKTYTLVASKGQNFSEPQKVSTINSDCSKPSNVKLALDVPGNLTPIQEGTVFQLPNIYYNYNDASLRPDAVKDLKGLLVVLNKFPEIEIELTSHTDARGTSEYNQQLSDQRATNVLAFLQRNGVASDRVSAKGMGETQIRNRCADGVKCSEKEHSYNRRTEVKVTKVNNPNIQFVQNDKRSGEGSNSGNNVVANEDKVSVEQGKFYVIAGVYSQAKNANVQLSKIQALGYAETKIVNFANSNYASVCVGIFLTQEEAKVLVDTLRNQGVEAFVKNSN